VNDDKDMKIVGRQEEIAELMPNICELDRQSANLEKARRLGQSLASELVAAPEKYGFDIIAAQTDGDSAVNLLQQRILLAFAVSVGLESFSVSPLVARTALSVFYNTLKRINYEFYEDINNSGSVSFYYLAKRRGIDVERRIGQTFAMLCGKDGNGVMCELGETLYCRFLASVKQHIIDIGLES